MRKADAYAHLERELRSAPPASLNSLRAAELEHLATSLQAARHRQAAEIAAASERALGYVPRLLRGPLRKALG